MEDEKIIALYERRSEDALKYTERAYGRYCFQVANNILGNREDSEECVSDAYIQLWNRIPPARPVSLKAYLAKIVRNGAINRLLMGRAQKRGGGEETLVLEELNFCLSDGRTPESELVEEEERRVAVRAIERCLQTLSPQARAMMIRRYFYLEPVREIARRYGTSEGQVRASLFRGRKKLREFLIGEGILR